MLPLRAVGYRPAAGCAGPRAAARRSGLRLAGVGDDAERSRASASSLRSPGAPPGCVRSFAHSSRYRRNASHFVVCWCCSSCFRCSPGPSRRADGARVSSCRVSAGHGHAISAGRVPRRPMLRSPRSLRPRRPTSRRPPHACHTARTPAIGTSVLPKDLSVWGMFVAADWVGCRGVMIGLVIAVGADLDGVRGQELRAGGGGAAAAPPAGRRSTAPARWAMRRASDLVAGARRPSRKLQRRHRRRPRRA